MNDSARVVPYGDRALLVEFEPGPAAVRCAAALLAAPPTGVEDIVTGACTVLVVFDPLRTDLVRLSTALARPIADPVERAVQEPLVIPAVYDGADLDEVSFRTGLARAEIVARHCAAVYTVAFVGFAPGFAYLTGGDPALRVPRRAAPRPSVPAGSVALADTYTGVYPRQCPGGWQLIGRTTSVLWNLGDAPPSRLTPGANVRFVEIGHR